MGTTNALGNSVLCLEAMHSISCPYFESVNSHISRSTFFYSPGYFKLKSSSRISDRRPPVRNSNTNEPFWRAGGVSRFRSQSAITGDVGNGNYECVNTSGNPRSVAASSQSVQNVAVLRDASEIVQEFYGAINRREIDSLCDLFAEDCVYEDLVFPKPFRGRQAVVEFFKKFMDSVGPELEFQVDDISTGDPSAVGVTWHLEWRGKPFPFSKGCSFYRCEVIDGKRQIKYGRDSVEPATKPGDFSLVALRGVASLLRRFPQLADRF